MTLMPRLGTMNLERVGRLRQHSGIHKKDQGEGHAQWHTDGFDFDLEPEASARPATAKGTDVTLRKQFLDQAPVADELDRPARRRVQRLCRFDAHLCIKRRREVLGPMHVL